MRFALLLGVFGICFWANAQNWAPLNPAYRYNFSNDGTDTISNQIRVIQVDTLGVDSFLYDLNPIGVACPFCPGVPIACATNYGLRIDQPQVFGLRAIAYGSQWLLIGEDSLLVEADATSGVSWTGPGGIQGTVTAIAEEDLFGQLDSVKQIDFSNGASMKISKAHGVTMFSASGVTDALIGVQGGLEAGAHFPEVIDLFDYQPGDILQYHGTDQGTDGMCFFNTTYTRKYEVLSRTDLPGHTDYSIHEVENWFTWMTPVIGGAICTGDQGSEEHFLSLGVEHDHYTPDNFLGSGWLDQLWPHAFAEPHTAGGGEFAGAFGSNESGSQWGSYLDNTGRYVIEPAVIEPDLPYMWSTFGPCMEDPTYWGTSWQQIIGRYVEGIGFTYGNYQGFEHASEEILEAYSIGGLEFGKLTPDDIILGLDENAMDDHPVIAPIPADEQIRVTGVLPGSAYSILDPLGRRIDGGRFNSSSISTAQLSSGTYFLRIEDRVPQRFMIAR